MEEQDDTEDATNLVSAATVFLTNCRKTALCRIGMDNFVRPSFTQLLLVIIRDSSRCRR
jgi:hypothetical protein